MSNVTLIFVLLIGLGVAFVVWLFATGRAGLLPAERSAAKGKALDIGEATVTPLGEA